MPDNRSTLQLDSNGELKHLLTLDGLSRELLTEILDRAETFLPPEGEQTIRKVPILRGKTVINLFFENSTRTRMTFDLAASRLSADVLTLDVGTSSASKGESLLDTLRNIEAMHAHLFVIRHTASGAAHFFAEHAAPGVSVLNAGDGNHAHPTQALLDMLTIRQHKGDFTKLSVAVVGDILHSRVARSQIHALRILGVPDIRICGPRTLLPVGLEVMGARVFDRLDDALEGVDVVNMLRVQRERMQGPYLPSADAYFHDYGLTPERLQRAKPDAIVMHPGPMNRGVEIDSAVADGGQSVILQQVTNGVAVRMAVMAMTLGRQGGAE